MYTYSSAVGRLIIRANRGGGGYRWELAIFLADNSYRYLGGFQTMRQAAAAVWKHETGWLTWDNNPRLLTDPTTLAAWTRGERTAQKETKWNKQWHLLKILLALGMASASRPCLAAVNSTLIRIYCGMAPASVRLLGRLTMPTRLTPHAREGEASPATTKAGFLPSTAVVRQRQRYYEPLGLPPGTIRFRHRLIRTAFA